MTATSNDPGDRVRERVRFTVSAGTAIKFGFFAAVGLVGFGVLVAALVIIAALVLAAIGFLTLPGLSG